jgi:hypothetical protein
MVLRGISTRGGRRVNAIEYSTLNYLWVVAAFGSLLGCQGAPSTVVQTPPDTSALRGIVRYYVIATGELGRPPQNMDELKSVLAPLTKEPDKYLRSTRDGEEFVVVWGQQIHALPAGTIIAYERKGVDGKRLVGDINANVREVTTEEFTTLKFPKNYKPEI